MEAGPGNSGKPQAGGGYTGAVKEDLPQSRISRRRGKGREGGRKEGRKEREEGRKGRKISGENGSRGVQGLSSLYEKAYYLFSLK
jgi:hypothetical protein